MADVQLADAVTLARDRILTLATYALSNAAGAFAYAEARGALDNYFELLLGGYDLSYPTQDSQRWTWRMDLRFKLGQFTMDYQGQVQLIAFSYMASAAQMFVQWRGLNDPTVAGSLRVPYLDVANVIVHQARTALLREEVGDVWYLIFPFTLPFDTRFARCGQ